MRSTLLARATAGLSMILVVGSACSHRNPAAPAPAQAFAGCYRIVLGEWEPSGGRIGMIPSNVFRLDTTSVSPAGSLPATFRAYPEVPGRHPPGRPTARWTPIGRDSVSVSWSNGFTSASLRLRVIGDSVVGRAGTGVDYRVAGQVSPTASVVGRRIVCPAD